MEVRAVWVVIRRDPLSVAQERLQGDATRRNGHVSQIFIYSGQFRQHPFARLARHGICLLGFSFGSFATGASRQQLGPCPLL